MYKVIVGLFLCIIAFYQLDAQILPHEGSKLNYRIIGFSFPAIPSVNKYKIEIAAGTCNNEISFEKNIIASFSSDTNRIIAEVPSFGKQYTWRYTCMNPVQKKSALYHFSTLIGPEVDTSVTRLRIMKHAETYKDAYVFSDCARTLYDMNGTPVWFLPDSKEMPVSDQLTYCNFKITNNGTITFVSVDDQRIEQRAYEINYNGDIVWKMPNNSKINENSKEYYQPELKKLTNGRYLGAYPGIYPNVHEFTKFSNGHYMLLGSDSLLLKLPDVKFSANDSILISRGEIIHDSINDAFYQKVEFGTVIEYDAKGNVVWSWKSSEYFIGSGVYNYTMLNGVYDSDPFHENAFYFDEKNKAIYVSYKKISVIIKIEYPSGNFLKVYGGSNKEGDLFYGQHNCSLTEEGYLSVYNNKDFKNGVLPTLLLMQEPVSEQDTLKKVWEYECTIEGMDKKYNGKEKNFKFGRGGSVMELPDHSILACMASKVYTKIFIVNRDKKILWSAFPERCNANEHIWTAINAYRAVMIIDKNELAKLIWNTKDNNSL